jgi:EAL domain-containing protein (putative c-di-GMP-specific phosphodiesterase class I)/GGDEF domain-containing protein
MATKRPGREGFFKSASRTSRKHTPTGPQAALVTLGGVAYAWDRQTDALAWGPNASEALGLAPDALPRTGQAFSQMVEPSSGMSRDAALAADGRCQAYDTRYALRFGAYKVVMVQDAGRCQPDPEGKPGLVRGLLRIDAGASAPDLLPAAVKDRSALLRRIQDDIDEAVRFSHTCTLIVGACEGDEVTLGEMTRGLRPIMRRGDHIAALGPNRFALILASCPAKEATNAMRRVAALLQDLCPEGSLHLGAACSPDHTFEAAKLLRFAEGALATAIKRSETAVLHKIRHNAPTQPSEHAPYDLVGALNDRRLTLILRPVVDGSSRRPALVQGCAGVVGRNGGATPLGDLPALDQANLSLLVDGRMLELAADHLVQNPEDRLVLLIAPATLQDREWLPMLAAHLGARPGIASRFIVQVPETVLLDTEAAKGRLDAMKALGLNIGVTGFGMGHASQAALQALPIDLATIDGVFIQSLKRSTADRLFVRTLSDMAHHLGIATMAEWVDNATTADWLTAWGVDYMHGDHFGAAEAMAEPQSILRRLKRA